MSLFCYGVLEGIESETERINCMQKLMQNSVEIGIGVQFHDFYKEQLGEECWALDTTLLWNISDGLWTTNCENLLCPDWCNTDESRPTLKCRLEKIKTILSVGASHGNRLSLWIGESGDSRADIEDAYCHLEQMISMLLDAYTAKKQVPTIHIVFTQELS